MTQDEYNAGSEMGKDNGPKGDGDRNRGGGKSDPNSVSPGTGPNWPFSITVTIEIKGHATTPPCVVVK